jgi:hypothetical protein
MNQPRFLLICTACLLSLLAVNPSLQAARKKQAAAKKAHPERTLVQSQNERFQANVEQQITNLKNDVYTRATWKALQEVKQEADDTAGKMKIMTLIGGGIGFVLGCVVTGLVAKRMGKSDDALRIT